MERDPQVVEMWECDFRRAMGRDEELRRLVNLYMRTLNPTSLSLRSCLFGGRTVSWA